MNITQGENNVCMTIQRNRTKQKLSNLRVVLTKYSRGLENPINSIGRIKTASHFSYFMARY